MLSETNVLILDEPTNHLDISSREALEDAVDEFGGTVIAVSHDRQFMQRLGSRFIEIGSKCEDYRGNYQNYLTERERRNAPAEEVKTVNAAPTNKEMYLARKEAEAEKRKAAARYKKAKAEIAELEKELEEITEKLFGEAATDYVLAAELDARQTRVEERLMELYEIESEYESEENV